MFKKGIFTISSRYAAKLEFVFRKFVFIRISYPLIRNSNRSRHTGTGRFDSLFGDSQAFDIRTSLFLPLK